MMKGSQVHTRAPRYADAHLSSGARLRYVEQGDADGEVLICLHAYTDSSFSFSRLMPLLPGSLRVFALDQRGHGDSERPARCYDIDDFAADAVAFLDAVGVERATLVGHSMGSLVARRVAETSPDRVARLVLIGTVATPVHPALRELREVVGSLPDPVPVEFVREFTAGASHVPLPEPFFERVVTEGAKAPAHVWRRALDGIIAFDDAADLGRIAAPTLILWGERDGLFPREDHSRLTTAIPVVRLTAYPETGHTPHWERPVQFATDIDAFLRGT